LAPCWAVRWVQPWAASSALRSAVLMVGWMESCLAVKLVRM
jgi:hypothetical protein